MNIFLNESEKERSNDEDLIIVPIDRNSEKDIALAVRIFNIVLKVTDDSFKKSGMKKTASRYTAKEFLSDMKKDRHYHPYILKLNGKSIGFAELHNSSEEKYGFWISTLGILEKYRGRGYGKRFLKLLIEEGRKKFKKKEAYIQVASHNIAAYNMYKRSGFNEIMVRMVLTE
jgi:ribosomal protein S18 acetylase RimI-like enzyme